MDSINNTYEQEIDLKDLMFAVLHKWRGILLAAVVLGLVLGGYKAYSTYQNQNDPETVQTAEETYETELKAYEKEKEAHEREIENLTTDIANQEEYLEKSILMNISPYDVWEAKVDMFVKTDYQILPDMVYQNIDYTSTILQTYQSVLTSTEFLKDIADQADTETRYLKELVTVTVTDNLISVQVRHESRAKAQAVLDSVLEGMEANQARITESIGYHTISEVNRSIGSIVDQTLADSQRTASDRLVTLSDNLETTQTELEELEEPEKAASSAKAAVTSGVKYAVLGGVLGAFVVVFFICVAFLMSSKVYSAKELRSRFQLKVLGNLASGKPARGIDGWLNRLEGRVMGTADQEYSLIAANVRNYSENIGTLLVTGTVSDGLIMQVAQRLEKELDGLRVISGSNMMQDAATLKKLPECDAVVLVEQCRVSVGDEIRLELEKVQDMQKAVIGCVVFD